MTPETERGLRHMSELVLAIADQDHPAVEKVLTEVDATPNGAATLVYSLANSIIAMVQGLAGDQWREALEESMKALDEED